MYKAQKIDTYILFGVLCDDPYMKSYVLCTT